MRHQSLPTIDANVVRLKATWLLVTLMAIGCGDDDRLPNYRAVAKGAGREPVVACASPAEGCPCEEAGRLVDCGEVRTRSGDYVTCTEGIRACRSEGTWGPCLGDLVTKSVSDTSGKRAEALGEIESCTESNPCDPLCRQIVDTGVGLKGLPEGMCSTATGLAPCPICGYEGPSTALPASAMPADWQMLPDTCSPQANTCPFDMDCVASECRSRTSPCTSSDPGCATDLTLGKPCFDSADPQTSYHIPLCNRGASDLTSGTIRIAVDSRSAYATGCRESASLDFPDSGSIEYTLAPGQVIAAGACVDVTPNNSLSSNLDLNGNRALWVNFGGAIAECNACNNGSALIASAESGELSTCAPCVNLQCNQTDPRTTLKGVVFDPGGNHPLPNVIVYVPNEAITPFVDGVACDSCESLVSGSPITWTTTDATGHFALANVPSGTYFPIVLQLGRWRREYRVQSIPSGQSAWAIRHSPTFGYVVVSLDANEPAPYWRATRRLRLPSTQRRCWGTDCAGEGDIPQMAVLMGDADPVQCTLRRIGISDSEFNCAWVDARVHIFTSDGMAHWDGWNATGPGGLITAAPVPGGPKLQDYSMLLAPCNQSRGGDQYAHSALGSGPSYNGWPEPHWTEPERRIVRDYVDGGGQLITTHWEALDLVHANFSEAPRANFGNVGAANPLNSPYAPDEAFAAAVSGFRDSQASGFSWASPDVAVYDSASPAHFLFGNNVESASNAQHDPVTAETPRYPRLAYGFEMGNPDGARFAAWASNVGATTTAGSDRMWWREWSPLVSSVRAGLGVTALLSADSRDAASFEGSSVAGLPQQPCLQGTGTGYDCDGRVWGDRHVGMFQFDTPVDSDQKCGRVAVASGHVSEHACFAPSGTRSGKYCNNLPPYSVTNPPPDCDCVEFPGSADLGCGTAGSPMSAEELAFEYLLFSSSQCRGTLASPYLKASLPRREFARDFEANCSATTHARWQLFSWQATVPANTTIIFYGSSADTQEELDLAQSVVIGVADRSTTTWTTSNRTVDGAFRNMSSPDVSRRWLRVLAVFEPNGISVPVLREWRAVFNCVESE